MSEIQTNEVTNEVTNEAPKVEQTTPETHPTPVADGQLVPKEEVKKSLKDKILEVLPKEKKDAITNAQIRKLLLMRSSKLKKGQEDLLYRALHPTMQKLAASGKVKFFQEGNAFRYYLAPQEEQVS